jgi:hypothetical protein
MRHRRAEVSVVNAGAIKKAYSPNMATGVRVLKFALNLIIVTEDYEKR